MGDDQQKRKAGLARFDQARGKKSDYSAGCMAQTFGQQCASYSMPV